MNKIITAIAGAAIVFAMSSCDKLDKPYFIEPVVSDTIPLTKDDTINFDGKIVVLLEDYTGVKCNNCPAAGEIALQLQQQYGHQLIVLGVHPKGALQNPAGGFPDFRTDDGNEWNNTFNIGAYPNGLVNRNGVVGPAEWATAVGDVIDNPAPARMVIKSEYDDADRELRLSVHTKILTDLPKSNLTICMMEDNILGKQVTSNGIDTAYMHRHVFRGTADGATWGRSLGDEELKAGMNFITNFKFNVDEKYYDEEFYIVAFLADANSKSIYMTAESRIK